MPRILALTCLLLLSVSLRAGGLFDAGVWAPFLPEPHKHRWQDLRAVVLPMEVEEVSRGVDYLFAGVRPMLTHLRELGVKVALASNCRRVYMGVSELPSVRNGLGVAIVSTPKGVLTDANARAANVGGEVLCTVF